MASCMAIILDMIDGNNVTTATSIGGGWVTLTVRDICLGTWCSVLHHHHLCLVFWPVWLKPPLKIQPRPPALA